MDCAAGLKLRARAAVCVEVNERELVEGVEEGVDALMAGESRRGALLVVPFLLAALAVIAFVLGDATRAVWVRVAFGACTAALVLRYSALRLLSRPDVQLEARGWRARLAVRTRALTASGWIVSAGFAAIYVSVGSRLSAVQLLMLTVVATAVCALGILSAASSLFKYAGYVSIHLGSLVVVIVRHGDPALVPRLPAMLVFFAAALMLIARRNNASLREKMDLAMKVRDFALRDVLTGLRNRTFAELFTEQRAAQLVEQWQNRGRRKGPAPRSLALLLVDLDHFKHINDKYGHAVGDQVLVAFGMVARSAVRTGDIVARWGGEEFLVVMEVDDRASANVVAERLRQMIAASPVADGSGRSVTVTCSIGACLFPFDPARPADLTWRETLEMADASLYHAKSRGRNRTMWSRPDPDFTPRQLLENERDGEATTAVFRKLTRKAA